MADASPSFEIEIETVPEVRAIDRETVTVLYHADNDVIHLMADAPLRDLQSIVFPASKAQAVCDAILKLAENRRG